MLMGRRDVTDYTALILVTPADFQRVAALHARLVHFLPARKVCFVGNTRVGELLEEEKANGLYERADEERVFFINEDDILPFDEVHRVRAEILDVPAARRATGWYYQQFLKMSYAAMCEDEYYMVWDGDTVPCVDFSMFSEEQDGAGPVPFFDVKQEYHEPYFVTMERLIPGMRKIIGRSFIAEHMLFRKDLMQKLIEKIEQNDRIPGERYWEKILRCLSSEELLSNSFSEFETYGTFVALNDSSAYKLREWHSFRLGGMFFDINTICERDFNWLGRDFLAISFEKKSELRSDTRNLFDNPYYQERLSARQMFQVIQEQTGSDLHDAWWDQEKKQEKEEEEIPGDDYKPAPLKPGQDALTAQEYLTYSEMGDGLQRTNPDQAWLCYENALFLCQDDDKKGELEEKMKNLRESGSVKVDKTAIVLVSHNTKNCLKFCLKSIYEHCAPSAYRLIVVENASTDGSAEWLQGCPYDMDLIRSENNLGFAGGANAGMCCSMPGQDVLLLHSDTRMTHNALFWLRMALYDGDHIGAVGAVSNYCRKTQLEELKFSSPAEFMRYAQTQNIPMQNPCEETACLDSFAMLLRSSVIDIVGGFDERFSPGFLEDTDYSLMLRASGYQLLVCHNAFVYHQGSQCFEKWTGQQIENQYGKNIGILNANWGFSVLDHTLITEKEQEFLYRISHGENESFRVLEIGAGLGNFLTMFQHKYPNAVVVGTESNEDVLRCAVSSVPVLRIDWRRQPLPFAPGYFDYILLCERQVNDDEQEEVDSVLSRYLRAGGKIMR